MVQMEGDVGMGVEDGDAVGMGCDCDTILAMLWWGGTWGIISIIVKVCEIHD